MNEARYQAGLRVRSEVMGSAAPRVVDADPHGIGRAMQEFAIEWAWGAVWTREGLSRKTRSIVNIALMMALNRATELEGHMRGALRNGVTPEELKEVILQGAAYCGVPAGGEASRIAMRVLAEHTPA